MAKKEKMVFDSVEVQDREESRKRREKNFRVWIEKSVFVSFPDEVELCHTKNGFQSSSFGVLPSEAKKIIEVLTQFVKESKK
jgi:hypothetical protein